MNNILKARSPLNLHDEEDLLAEKSVIEDMTRG
jgi:hypothetical protein